LALAVIMLAAPNRAQTIIDPNTDQRGLVRPRVGCRDLPTTRASAGRGVLQSISQLLGERPTRGVVAARGTYRGRCCRHDAAAGRTSWSSIAATRMNACVLYPAPRSRHRSNGRRCGAGLIRAGSPSRRFLPGWTRLAICGNRQSTRRLIWPIAWSSFHARESLTPSFRNGGRAG